MTAKPADIAATVAKELAGYTIVSGIVCPDDEYGGFIARHPETGRQVVVWIDRDEEDNGCGHIKVAVEKRGK